MMKTKLVAMLLLTGMLLTACFKMAPTAEADSKQLILDEKDNFESQVDLQFGDEFKLTKVRAETLTHYDPVWIGGTIHTGSNLLGTLTNDKDEEFKAIYVPSDNVLLTNKNIGKITQSTIDDLKSDNLNILDLQVRNDTRTEFMLEDEIKTYQEIIERGGQVLITVVTDSDLSKITTDDLVNIVNLLKKHEDRDGSLSLAIAQIDDPDNAVNLGNKWSSSGLDMSSQIKFANQNNYEQNGDITKYGVISSIQLNTTFKSMYYSNINGDYVKTKIEY